MKMRLTLFLTILFLAYGMVSGEETSADEMSPGEANSNNGGPKPEAYEVVTIVEGPNSTKSENTKRGLKADPRCRYSVHTLHNVGSILRCGCLRCVCTNSQWLCDYHFKYCPYFYCGNKIFNPLTHICCCGATYAKKKNFACCGYKYYNTGGQKCCSYSTIKNKGDTCPRYEVSG